MKRFLKMLLLLTLMSALSSCGAADTNGEEIPENISEQFVMKVEILSVGDKIEVNVYEAEYAEGIYWINVDEGTAFLDRDGRKIAKSDLKVGDRAAVYYSGQIMMSYPPQIYAAKIQQI